METSLFAKPLSPRCLQKNAGCRVRTANCGGVGAGILVVGSPTYKGSFTGLFKHFFDLVKPAALRGKPVVLTATGGGDRHALIAEHSLRPLFGFFEALTLPTAIYASDREFVDDKVTAEATLLRVSQAVGQATAALKSIEGMAIAAERYMINRGVPAGTVGGRWLG